MTKDEIIKLAREAGAGIGTSGRWLVTQDELERFTAKVEAFAAAKEREACAQTCEERHANGNYQHDTRHECAEAIRARGQTDIKP